MVLVQVMLQQEELEPESLEKQAEELHLFRLLNPLDFSYALTCDASSDCWMSEWLLFFSVRSCVSQVSRTA